MAIVNPDNPNVLRQFVNDQQPLKPLVEEWMANIDLSLKAKH